MTGERGSLTKIDDIVQDLKGMIFVFADPLKYNVKFSCCADLHPVAMEKIQLTRVIGNIITNATQAMPKGGNLFINVENVYVDYNGARSAGSGPYLKISIADTGDGIDDASLARVLEPRFATRPNGSGLGLSIAKTLVERRGGYIDVGTRPGQGTTFAIYLPGESL